jgi:hypothetical protein
VPPPENAERLAAVERAVAELQRDVGELRAALLAASTPAGAAPPTPGAAVPPPLVAPPAYVPRHLRPSLGARAAAFARAQAVGLGIPAAGAAGPDVEALVGRYATVAVAALLILTGVGAFLTWAVSTFTITPAARVAMGVVLSGVMAAGGWRLRGGAGGAAAADMARRRRGRRPGPRRGLR